MSPTAPAQDIFEPPKSSPMSMYKTPKQTLLVIIKAGIAKGLLLWWQIVFLGWQAGIFVAVGAGLTIAVNGNISLVTISGVSGSNETNLELVIPKGVLKMIAGCIFPIGLVMVVLTGVELFTGNVMYLAAARMANKTSWKNLVSNWVFCYFGNLAGSLATAYFLFHKAELFCSDYEFPTDTQKYLFHVVEAKTSLEMWWPYFLRAIGCNFLVCLAIWCVCAADDIASKVIALWWPIMGFVAVGYEHSVANMFFVPLAIMEGYDLTVNQFIRRNLIPVTLGNIVGGILFISVQYLIYHPYIEKDVEHMKIRQGSRTVEKMQKLPSDSEGDDGHHVPGHENTMFKGIHEVWLSLRRNKEGDNVDSTRVETSTSGAASGDNGFEIVPTTDGRSSEL